jgi:hypothetical protein
MTDLSSLEPDQLTSVTRKPLPRKKLGLGEWVLLTIMRVYVLVAIPIVAYAFIRALRAG